MTLNEKLGELCRRLTDLHNKLLSVHMDSSFTNDENREYTDLMKEYVRTTQRIWALKKAWLG